MFGLETKFGTDPSTIATFDHLSDVVAALRDEHGLTSDEILEFMKLATFDRSPVKVFGLIEGL